MEAMWDGGCGKRPAIMQAIVAIGFNGHVAQEFVPKRPDVLGSLRQGVNICDV